MRMIRVVLRENPCQTKNRLRSVDSCDNIVNVYIGFPGCFVRKKPERTGALWKQKGQRRMRRMRTWSRLSVFPMRRKGNGHLLPMLS